MITLHQVQQGSSEWHELRAGKITGSNAHKLLKYGMCKEILTVANGFKGNFHTKRGHILEDEAIELYEAITNIQVYRPGFVTNSRYPNAGYSPDGLTDMFVIEVKCFAADRYMKLYAGNIPMEVTSQIHFGMFICEKKAGRLVIYNPDLSPELAFKIIKIPFNRKIHNNFKKLLRMAVT